MKTPSRRQVLHVIVLLVRAADQVGAAFESLIDEQDGFARLLHVLCPINAKRTKVSGGRVEQRENFLLLHGTRLFAPDRG